MKCLIRSLDIVGALVGLALTLPILVISAVTIRLETPGPVIFKQKRVGADNKLFSIYKLRTMVAGAPQVAKNQLSPEIGAHVTKVGRFLRRASIDELPQLVNILKGDMSLVGPRPALFNQSDLVKLRTELGIHTMRPGLTGLAQIMGREDMSIQQKVEYDHELLRSYSLCTYLTIVLRTFMVLFSSRGAY